MNVTDRKELVKLAAALGAMSARLSYEQDRLTAIAACELLRRLASSDGGVKVRELEWEKGVTELHYGALSVFGDYSVWTYHDAGKWFWQNSRRDYGQADTLDAAKAAAQADYEARIKSALVEVPAVKGEPEPVAWQPYGYLYSHDGCLDVSFCKERKSEYMRNEPWTETPVFIAPPADAGMREALGKICIYRVEGDASIHLLVDGEKIGAFGQHTSRAMALLRLEACLRDACIDAALTAPGATTKSDGGLTLEMETRRADDNGRSCKHFCDALRLIASGAPDAVAIATADIKMPWLLDEVGPSDPSPTRSEVTVEELAAFLDPRAFDEDQFERHKYCSPLSIEVVQDRARDKARALLDQFEIRRK